MKRIIRALTIEKSRIVEAQGCTGDERLSPQVLAYRYLGTRVRLRLTTGIAAPLVPADKKPATKRTRDAKSARDVSIDSLTADL